MISFKKRALLCVPVVLAPLAALALLGTGCELAVNLDPSLVDGGTSDVFNCTICADVSVDAEFASEADEDAGDDAASADATVTDAAPDGPMHDATVTD